MKEITLSNTDKVALVDDEDYERLNERTWRLTNKGYAAAFTTLVNDGKRKQFCLLIHRVILGQRPGDGVELDHINGLRLDNRKENLRRVTRRGNLRNRRGLGGGFYGPRLPFGVAFVKSATRNPFHARIQVGKRTVHIGCFSTPHEASAAYESALVSYGLEQSFSA